MGHGYYVYSYLRAHDSMHGLKGTPYYVGKGKGKRAYEKHRVPVPTERERITFLGWNLTERQALSAERHFISFCGRIDQHTGCLRNLTDGGDGSNYWQGIKRGPMPDEWRRKIGDAHRGQKRSLKARMNMSRAMRGNHNSLGKHVSPELIERRRLSMKAYYSDPEARRKVSERMMGNKNGCGHALTEENARKLHLAAARKDACIYCGKVCRVSLLSRWHNDNCKQKRLGASQ